MISTQPHRRYTLEEYLDLDASSEERYEYFGGEVFCISGGSPEHDRVNMNITVHLSNKLGDGSCELFSSNVRVKVPAAPPYRYPDLTATCAAPEFERINGINSLTNPELIVEVLSTSTEGYDRGDKFTEYKSIASFREYLLVAQHRPHITHYTKDANGHWSYEEINGLDGSLYIATLGCELKLRDVYKRVNLSPQP